MSVRNEIFASADTGNELPLLLRLNNEQVAGSTNVPKRERDLPICCGESEKGSIQHVAAVVSRELKEERGASRMG